MQLGRRRPTRRRRAPTRRAFTRVHFALARDGERVLGAGGDRGGAAVDRMAEDVEKLKARRGRAVGGVAVVAPIASFLPSCPREFGPTQSSPSSRRATEWKRPAANALIGDLPAPPSQESGGAWASATRAARRAVGGGVAQLRGVVRAEGVDLAVVAEDERVQRARRDRLRLRHLSRPVLSVELTRVETTPPSWPSSSPKPYTSPLSRSNSAWRSPAATAATRPLRGARRSTAVPPPPARPAQSSTPTSRLARCR